MDLDGPQTHEQRVGNLLVRLAGGHHAQHVMLALRQPEAGRRGSGLCRLTSRQRQRGANLHRGLGASDRCVNLREALGVNTFLEHAHGKVAKAANVGSQ